MRRNSKADQRGWGQYGGGVARGARPGSGAICKGKFGRKASRGRKDARGGRRRGRAWSRSAVGEREPEDVGRGAGGWGEGLGSVGVDGLKREVALGLLGQAGGLGRRWYGSTEVVEDAAERYGF
jgi:hypothetical protein